MRISVIIPFYGSLEPLKKAITSVQNQNVNDLEIVVVDDNPKAVDSVRRKIQSLGDNIIYIKNCGNKGAAFSRNFGVDISKGDYIFFLDSDDYFLENKILKQITELLHYDLVYCNCYIFDGVQTCERAKHKLSSLRWRLLFGWTAPNTSSLSFRKSAFKEIGGFNEDLSSGQDHDLWFSVMKNKLKVKFIEEPLYVFDNDTNRNRISTRRSDIMGSIQLLVKHHGDELSTVESIILVNVWRLKLFKKQLRRYLGRKLNAKKN